MKRVAVLVSGGGSNLQALIDAKAKGEIPHGDIVLVISSKPDVKALDRAQEAGIPTRVVPPKSYETVLDFNTSVLAYLRKFQIDVVVLAGYLSVLDRLVVQEYKDRIINVHPSLIPSFCGDGFYGLRVHKEVLARGVKVTGATVHLVNEVVDGGPILLQKPVEVLPGDTPESLQKRVMEEAEWILLPQGVEMVCKQAEKEDGTDGL